MDKVTVCLSFPICNRKAKVRIPSWTAVRCWDIMTGTKGKLVNNACEKREQFILREKVFVAAWP